MNDVLNPEIVEDEESIVDMNDLKKSDVSL